MLQQPQAPGGPALALPDLGDSNDADFQEARTSWWRRRNTIIIAAIVLLILILAAVALPLLNQKPKAVYVTQPVTQGSLSITVGATGPLTSSVYNLGFTGTGVSGATIQEINVKVGDKVKKGQILAKVDPTTLQNAYNSQLAVVQADEAAVASAQNNQSAQAAAGNTSVAAAQTALAQDQKAQSITQQAGQASVASAQQTLTNDQNALNTTQQQVNNSNNQAYQQLQTSLNNCNNATATASSSSSTCQSLAYATYNTALASTKATLQNAQAKVAADQKALNAAQIAANSNNQAAAAKITSDQSAINNTKASTNTSSTSQQGSVTSAQEQLNQALLTLKQDKQNLDNATLKAPNDGTVTVINGNVGGSPGVPANAANSSTTTTSSTFIQLVDTSAMQIQANVNETDTANLKIGEVATFTVNAYSGQTFKGTVSAISPNGETVSNVVTYPVTIDVDKTSLNGASLLPNMTANVTITVIQRTGAILIPVDAINYARLAAQSTTTNSRAISQQEVAAATQQARQMYATLQGNNPDIVASDSPTASYVLEKDSQGKLIAKPVVLGLTDGVSYEVLAGLTTSDTIVTSASGGGALKATGTSTSGSGGGPGGGGPGGGGPAGP